MNMEFRTFEVDGPLEVVPRKIEDERGYFSEILRLDLFRKHAGKAEFVQDNQSHSIAPGTVRGIHFQTHPMAQGKLVRCLAGSLFDVAVDLRVDSPTFGRWIATTLTAELNNQLWVPVGFGHVFCRLGMIGTSPLIGRTSRIPIRSRRRIEFSRRSPTCRHISR
jgi:dTDP-4-dehydrorhamnose 3,5-epimerase